MMFDASRNPIEQITEDDIDRTYAANTKGVLLVTQTAGVAVQKSGGKVITPSAQ